MNRFLSLQCIYVKRTLLSSTEWRIMGLRYVSDAPLTIRSSNMAIKKVYKDLKVKEDVEKMDMMDPVDIHELPKIHQGFARDIERTNKLRVNEMFRKIYQGLAVLTACTFFVVGVYYYGCYLMGNESLLEEIDEEVALERGELEMDEQGNLRPAKDTAIHR